MIIVINIVIMNKIQSIVTFVEILLSMTFRIFFILLTFSTLYSLIDIYNGM